MELPEKENDAAEVDETEEVISGSVPASGNPSPALEPGKEPLDLPAALVAAEFATVLLAGAVALLRRDQVDAALLLEAQLERSPVPSFVGDQSRRQLFHESSIESSFGEHTVESVSRGNIDSEWKTMAVCNRHEFRRLPGTTLPDAGPPFFAGT